jgi:hypothetical protein
MLTRFTCKIHFAAAFPGSAYVDRNPRQMDDLLDNFLITLAWASRLAIIHCERSAWTNMREENGAMPRRDNRPTADRWRCPLRLPAFRDTQRYRTHGRPDRNSVDGIRVGLRKAGRAAMSQQISIHQQDGGQNASSTGTRLPSFRKYSFSKTSLAPVAVI